MNRWKWQAISRILVAYRHRKVAGPLIAIVALAPWPGIIGVAVYLLRSCLTRPR